MSKYFFKSWIGAKYSEGFDGLRTLIVAPHMICLADCPFKDKCGDSQTILEMDTECPLYKDLDPEVMRLSNTNAIEVDAFIKGTDGYPSYNAFTYYMLGKRDYLSQGDKSQLWDSVAFTNFLQHMRPSAEPCDPTLFEKDYKAFREALESIDPQPQVLYVWNTMVKDCLKSHPEDFKYIGMTDMGYALSVYIFVPVGREPSSNALRRLRYKRGVVSERHQLVWYKNLVTKHLGSSFEGDKKTVFRLKTRLAQALMDWVESGWLGVEGMTLHFRDNDKFRWTTDHIGYFRNLIKENFCPGQGAVKGLIAMFDEPNFNKYYKAVYTFKPHDLLKEALDRSFGKSLGN